MNARPLLLMVLCAATALGNESYRGWCEQGGHTVTTAGMSSVTKTQASYPLCTLTIYPHGSTTPVASNQVFSDNSGTVLGNPFTADSSGYFTFFVANGHYDIKRSGTIPTWTEYDVLFADPSGSASAVTSVSAGAGIAVSGPATTPTVTNAGVTSAAAGAGVSVSGATGGVTFTNTWGAAPSGSQLQQLQIQPNTGNNTTYQWASKPILIASDYNFPALTPGGSLSAGGVGQVVTLAPVPVGLNGSDANHWVRLDGGTGTAEAVLILGGTAVSGAASGTIVFTPANAHSGAWTVTSAEGGIRNAIIAGGSYASVQISAGTTTAYSPIFSEFGAVIYGQGSYQTFIVPATQNQDVFHVVGSGGIAGEIGHMRIVFGAGSVSTCQHGAAIILDNSYLSPVIDVEIYGFDYGIKVQSGANPLLTDVDIENPGIAGLVLNPAGTGQAGVDVKGMKVQGWGVTSGTVMGIWLRGTVAGAKFANVSVTGVPVGWKNDPGAAGAINEIQATNIDLDSVGTIGLWNSGTRTTSGGGATHTYIGLRIASATAASTGIQTDSGFSAVKIIGGTINVLAIGVNLRGPRNFEMSHVNILQNNGVGVASDGIAITADTDGSVGSAIILDRNDVGRDINGGLTSSYQFGLFLDTAATGDVTVSNSNIYGSGNPLVVQGTGGAGVTYRFLGNAFSGAAISNSVAGSAVAQFINNLGADLGVATVASIASNTITLPATHENTILVSADGSGGVATITAPNGTQWTGRSVRMVATHASGIAFNATGNIRTAKTLMVGQSVQSMWDGTKWDLIASGAAGSASAATNSTSSVASTPFLTAPTPGLYRVSWTLTTGSVSGGTATALVTIGWTDAVGAKAASGAALTLGAGANQSGSVLARVASGNLTYATTYAAGTGGNYSLAVTAELVN